MMQDRSSPSRQSLLATHGIHSGQTTKNSRKALTSELPPNNRHAVAERKRLLHAPQLPGAAGPNRVDSSTSLAKGTDK
jgi:hypothetical protein